ncbi:MAG: DUF3052 family protein [Rubrivivax sp.]|nr:DUF3052 family protein [Rubrivivax sp.]
MAKKLGFKDGQRALLQGAVPEGYADMLAPLPPGVVFASRLSADVALVQLFATERRELSERLQAFRRTLGPEAMVWVSWPKKSAKVPTDITEDVVREVALPLGFVDVKVCAVDATWSGLKLVVRKALR